MLSLICLYLKITVFVDQKNVIKDIVLFVHNFIASWLTKKSAQKEITSQTD